MGSPRLVGSSPLPRPVGLTHPARVNRQPVRDWTLPSSQIPLPVLFARCLPSTFLRRFRDGGPPESVFYAINGIFKGIQGGWLARRLPTALPSGGRAARLVSPSTVGQSGPCSSASPSSSPMPSSWPGCLCGLLGRCLRAWLDVAAWLFVPAVFCLFHHADSLADMPYFLPDFFQRCRYLRHGSAIVLRLFSLQILQSRFPGCGNSYSGSTSRAGTDTFVATE